MSSSTPSNDSNDLVRLPQSNLVSASSSKRSCMLHLSNDYPNSIQLQDRSGSFASEEFSALEDNEDPPNVMSKGLLLYEDDWITELSLTEEETLQAAESERQAIEVALTQMAALRTHDWVGNTFECGSSITPPLQIQSSSIDWDDEYKGAFSVFAPSESAWSDEGMQNDDGSREDPFQTPPNKRSSPRTTFDLPLDPSFAPDSSVAEMATPRDKQLFHVRTAAELRQTFCSTRFNMKSARIKNLSGAVMSQRQNASILVGSMRFHMANRTSSVLWNAKDAGF